MVHRESPGTDIRVHDSRVAVHDAASPFTTGLPGRYTGHVIRSVAVVGAGVMGSQIAAHVANAGVPVVLLDVTAEAAASGLRRCRALKPDPFFTADTAALIATAGLDEGLARIANAD